MSAPAARPPHRLLAGLATAGLLVAGAAAAGSDPHAARVAQLAERVVQQVAAQADFNGAVVLMRDGQVVYERGIGLAQRGPDRAFTPDTPSDGGSLAKTLTAATVWELVAEGRLSYADKVQRHLPEYPYPQHTLRDLVTHRSGLPDYDFFDPDFKPGQTRDTIDLLRVLQRRKPPAAADGLPRIEYANLGFDAAALVVERITGSRIEAWWRERYFKPLGIAGMHARPALFADWPGARTPGYQRKAGAWVPNDAIDGEAFIGASNVHASARDWARWGDAFARARLMAPERLEAGLREPMLDSGMDNRLNLLSWYCDGTRQRCHYTGAYNGFFAQVYWDRGRRDVVAYVSNSTLPPWRCARLTRDLVAALAGHEPQPEAGQPQRVALKDLPRWAGTYRSPTLGVLQISSRGARALVQVGGGERVSMFAVSGGLYYAPMLDLWLAFDGRPAAARLSLSSVFHQAVAQRDSAAAGKTPAGEKPP